MPAPAHLGTVKFYTQAVKDSICVKSEVSLYLAFVRLSFS